LQGHAIKNQDLLLASGTVSLKGSAGMSAVDEDVEAAENTQSLSLRQADSNAVDLQTRDRELNEIAKSIASLAELFKDLSVLVIDQGTLLDSVEYNIEQTAVQVKDAVQELDIATRQVFNLRYLLHQLEENPGHQEIHQIDVVSPFVCSTTRRRLKESTVYSERYLSTVYLPFRSECRIEAVKYSKGEQGTTRSSNLWVYTTSEDTYFTITIAIVPAPHGKITYPSDLRNLPRDGFEAESLSNEEFDKESQRVLVSSLGNHDSRH
ncbi:hypothetical protein EV361DRAFT_872816, partial [Lentinula raphanica]